MKAFVKAEIFNSKKYSFLELFKEILFNTNARFNYLIRLLEWARRNKRKYLVFLINNYLITRYGCFIGKNAEIGIGVNFPHPNGIIIGDAVSIGNNCIIYHQVTFGGKNSGDAKKGNYPQVGNNVTIFAGAKLLGAIIIGNNSIIGANSVVIKNVPDNAVVAGIPAKIIKIKND